jgi:hypothetical protein
MGSNLVTPNLAINVVKKINFANSLYLPRVKKNKNDSNSSKEDSAVNGDDLVEIGPPVGATHHDNIKIRILSTEMLKGMVSNLMNYPSYIQKSELISIFI